MPESVEVEIQRERAAKNQSLFREVNERIDELAGSSSLARFICECANERCDEAVSLTIAEYEKIRSDSNRFFVVRGHDIREVEEIVDEADGYAVVAKLGTGGAVAERFDPRKRGNT